MTCQLTGLVPLTGEACGLSYRILCDVTARGKKTLEKALSIAQLGLHENWNHGNADDPHVGSLMLAPDLLPFIGGVRPAGGRLPGGLADQGPARSSASRPMTRRIAWRSFKRIHANDLARRFGYAGTAGDRNQHMMTGRVV